MTRARVFLLFALTGTASWASEPVSKKADSVTGTPGCVAFWDFVKREPDGTRRFVAHVPLEASNSYALDAAKNLHFSDVLRHLLRV